MEVDDTLRGSEVRGCALDVDVERTRGGGFDAGGAVGDVAGEVVPGALVDVEAWVVVVGDAAVEEEPMVGEEMDVDDGATWAWAAAVATDSEAEAMMLAIRTAPSRPPWPPGCRCRARGAPVVASVRICCSTACRLSSVVAGRPRCARSILTGEPLDRFSVRSQLAHDGGRRSPCDGGSQGAQASKT